MWPQVALTLDWSDSSMDDAKGGDNVGGEAEVDARDERAASDKVDGRLAGGVALLQQGLARRHALPVHLADERAREVLGQLGEEGRVTGVVL